MRFNEIPMPKKKLTPIQSIKFYCRYVCCCNDVVSWRECPVEKCILHKFRLGKRPEKKPFEYYTKPKTEREKHDEKQAVLTIKNPKNSEYMEVNDETLDS